MNENEPVPRIALRGVGIELNHTSILRDISLHFYPNTTNVIIGESGCGKTVLLKLIVGLLQPSFGQVFLYGKDLASMKEAELQKVRLRVGFLFQGAALFDSLNVFQNVAFALQSHRDLSEDEIRRIVFERLIEVGLPESAASKMPSELSGGMRKRVGLARALALDPEVMLYDEPTTGLDPIMTEVINDLILQTRSRRPITSIVVTHDMKTVRKVADRVVMLYPRSKLESGETQMIFDGTVANLDSAVDPRIRNFVK